MRKKSKVTIKKNSDSVINKLETMTEKMMFGAAHEVRKEILRTLQSPPGSRSGRTYRVPGTQQTYTASAPGEPPARQFGHLANSIDAVVIREGKSVKGVVGTDLIKGLQLEKGTSKMAPRPWLEPSFKKAEPKVAEKLQMDGFQFEFKNK